MTTTISLNWVTDTHFFWDIFYIFSNLYWIVLDGIIYISKTRSVKTVLVDDEIILTICSSNKHS